MDIRVNRTSWDSVRCDSLILPIFTDDDFQSGFAGNVDKRLDGLLAEMRDNGELLGKLGEVAVLYRPAGTQIGRLVLAGADASSHFNADAVRRTIQEAFSRIKSKNLKSLAVCLRRGKDALLESQAAIEATVMGAHQLGEFKTLERHPVSLQEVILIPDGNLKPGSCEEIIERGKILGEATNLARLLVNQPGNCLGPTQMANRAAETAQRYGLQVRILGEPELEKEGMNALLAVARGSDEPARLIVLTHQGASPESRPYVLVGKGVTFDSGGLSLKTPEGMIEMKSDKAGGCAVLAAMIAIAQLRLPRNVVGLIPTVENLPSGRAQRPGDVIRSLCGKTIEVINTDAEGRLILADAFCYAQRFNPVALVDVATLTGACVVALGKLRAGAFCNNEDLFQRVAFAAKRAGERIWRLPLDKEYRDDLDSDIADLKNAGARWGGACAAAKFLEEFTADVPWCHLDIAGVDLFPESSCVKGPTGFGVRTLVELVALKGSDSGSHKS